MSPFQACKGKEFDLGVQVPVQTDTPFGGGIYSPAPGAPPAPTTKETEYGAIMIAYSTIPGFVSWRDTSNGSWFIQDLCEVNDICFVDRPSNTISTFY